MTIPEQPVGDICARCGKPAEGFATIGDDRYCHGDGPGPTCYMLQQWEDDRLPSTRWTR